MQKPLLRCGMSCALLLAACDSGGPRPLASTIHVTTTSVTLLVGDTLHLTAQASTSNGEAISQGEIVWTTSDHSVASVSASGLVTAAASGPVTIYAMIDALTDSAVLLVIRPFAAVHLAAGGAFTCAIANGDAGYCWGANYDGSLGNGLVGGTSNRPSLIVGGLAWSSMTAGERHACGMTTGATSYCWGHNSQGQLGDGSSTSRVRPAMVNAPLQLSEIAAGWNHTCGLTATGASCWGNMADITGLSLEGLTSGWDHSCALSTTGAAYCWGGGFNGQLGDGSTGYATTPVVVAGSLSLASIDAGSRFTCGLDGSGSAYCWGDNGSGQLGDGTTTGRLVPIAVTGSQQFSTISSGSSHVCALTTQGAAWCWGDNSSGQLGDGTLVDSNHPIPVAGGLVFTSIAAGGSHTCAIGTGNQVYCWGSNSSGQLGDNSETDHGIPMEVWAP